MSISARGFSVGRPGNAPAKLGVVSLDELIGVIFLVGAVEVSDPYVKYAGSEPAAVITDFSDFSFHSYVVSFL